MPTFSWSIQGPYFLVQKYLPETSQLELRSVITWAPDGEDRAALPA